MLNIFRNTYEVCSATHGDLTENYSDDYGDDTPISVNCQYTTCELCHKEFLTTSLQKHLNTKKHIEIKQIFTDIKNAKKYAEQYRISKLK